MNIQVPLLKPVIVLEDDPIAQMRIQSILEQFGYTDADLYFAQTIEAANQHIVEQHPIGLFLVDIHLPDGTGIDFIRYLRQVEHSTAPVLVLSSWNTYETIYTALSVGATGFILKERDDFDVMFAVRSLLKGEAIIDPKIAKEILKNFHLKSEQEDRTSDVNIKVNLSQREFEILNLIASGMSSKEIGEQINISRYTVDAHIKKIYQKLEVNSRTKALHVARKMGLLCSE